MKEIRIFWAGDSTVKHNRISSYPQTGIGQVFDLYLKPEVRIYNFAENGRSTKSFIDEGRLACIAQELKEEDFFLIQFGHNDEKEDPLRHTKSYGSYQDNLRQFIRTARDHGAYPVLVTPVARRHFNDRGEFLSGSHGEYPDAMLALGSIENVPVVDLRRESELLLKESGEELSRKWFMNIRPGEYPNGNFEEGLQDNTHMKYEGAVIMAGLVAKGFRELKGIYGDLLLSEERHRPL